MPKASPVITGCWALTSEEKVAEAERVREAAERERATEAKRLEKEREDEAREAKAMQDSDLDAPEVLGHE